MPGTSDVSPISSSLFAFKPRQVLLLEHQQRRSLALPESMEKVRPENPAQMNPDDESVLIFSVAVWLEKKGFSKVLKRFLSAAQIQDDTWKAKALNLNEIFSKYQEICNRDQEEVKSEKKQEDRVEDIKETNGYANCTAGEKIKSKNKKKKGEGDKTVTDTGKIYERTTIGVITYESNVHDKESDGLIDKNQKSEPEEVCELTVDQSSKKTKDRKKKKNKSTSDVMPEPTESKNQGLLSNCSGAEALEKETAVDDESKKASKKRKRMAPDDDERPPGDVEEANKQKTEENSVDGRVGSKDSSTQRTDDSKLSTNKANGVDKSGQQKPAKRQRNNLAEPKTVNAFQRVKIDEVEFVDERLQDNSYWAKGGAETGYGAKAQEILGQVKGRNFRHEKTKKKRGSYRGGQIDMHTHSIKFNYSDEE